MNQTRMRHFAVALIFLLIAGLPLGAQAATKKPAATSTKATATLAPVTDNGLRASPNPEPRAYDPVADVSTLTADQLIAQSAILIDADTGKVLFEKDPHRRMFPASTTKILTTLLAIENGDLNDMVTAPKDVMSLEATYIRIRPGEQMSLLDALYGVMLMSYNDLAYTVATYVSGSEKGFAALMNSKAKSLGCTESNFVTPHGLPNPDHYTTASDMAKIASAAIKNETFRTIMSTHSYMMPAIQENPNGLVIENRNLMLPDSSSEAFAYPYSLGIKTGYTINSAHTYVGAAKKDGVNLVAVVFGTTTDGKWTDTRKLFDYGFSTYNEIDLAALISGQVYERQVEGVAAGDENGGMLRFVLKDAGDARLGDIRDTPSALESFTSSISEHVQFRLLRDELRAPIHKGDELAELTITYPGKDPITVPLVADRDVAARENALSAFFSDTGTKANAQAQEASAMGLTGTAQPKTAAAFPWTTVIPIGLGVLLLMYLFSQRNRPRKRKRTVASRYYASHYGGTRTNRR